NRAAESKYQSTHSMDQTLLTLANEFNTVARNNYQPLPSAVQTSVPTPETANQPTGTVATLALCGQVCIGLIIFLFFIWMVSQMRGGGGGGFYRPGSWGSGGSPWGGGFGGFRTGGGRGSSSPRMRGGSGSGRSGRTN